MHRGVERPSITRVGGDACSRGRVVAGMDSSRTPVEGASCPAAQIEDEAIKVKVPRTFLFFSSDKSKQLVAII